MLLVIVGLCFPNREARGEREREQWALFIGEVEMVVYILFYWLGEMLQVGHQIYTTWSLKVVIKSIYL
jgi:hypothetical protein